MEHFQEVLAERYGLGEAFAGWNLGAIQSVSANGQYFAGWALGEH